MNKFFPVICAALAAASAGYADDAARFSLLYSGAWSFDQEAETGKLENRLDGRVFFFNRSFYARAQILERSPAPPFEPPALEHFNAGAGLYHKKTGSRLLYGRLQERGALARARNPWTRSAPFVESHEPAASDLVTDFSSVKEAKYHLFLSSPDIIFSADSGFLKNMKHLSVYAAGTLDADSDAVLSGGVRAGFGKTTGLRVEFFWNGLTLPPRSDSAWFAVPPALPVRQAHVYAAAAVFTSAWVDAASDWAFSETAAFGRGVYGSVGVRVGKKPWLFSIAADGAGDRFTGGGDLPKQGFRAALKLEYYGKRNSVLRLRTTLRSTALGDMFEADGLTTEHVGNSVGAFFRKFDQSETDIYWRLPALRKSPAALSRISVSAARDAREGDRAEDSYKVELGFILWRLRCAASGSLIGFSYAGADASASAATFASPYPVPHGWVFDSGRVHGSVSCDAGMFRFGLGAGWTVKPTAAVWNGSLSVSVRGKGWRLGIKAASEAFPREWTYTVSGRFAL
jgi:hypothetical protein